MVNISIYNTSGQLVEMLINESQTAGLHEVQWNADLFPSGLYYYQMKAGESTFGDQPAGSIPNHV